MRAVKFVGSTPGGMKIAEICGKAMKKGAFELGGSDPFIVLDDADMELAVSKAITGRLGTNGQACTNSKRFIIHEAVYDEFANRLKVKLDEYIKFGDPLDEKTTIGPLSMKK